ncbi:hypothetical protein CTB96_11625 [Cryobacterium arcticum]|uniref:Uncharacterized protein n=1 Tax=Cryobacterium arcticum TaxID=670052 RepID=A0A317ZLG1_9MICO|nr:hypothetical protein CTB96_11625 [Cryobacterium arcticum]
MGAGRPSGILDLADQFELPGEQLARPLLELARQLAEVLRRAPLHAGHELPALGGEHSVPGPTAQARLEFVKHPEPLGVAGTRPALQVEGRRRDVGARTAGVDSRRLHGNPHCSVRTGVRSVRRRPHARPDATVRAG